MSTILSIQIHLRRIFSWSNPLVATNNNLLLRSSESSIHLGFILYQTAIAVLISVLVIIALHAMNGCKKMRKETR